MNTYINNTLPKKENIALRLSQHDTKEVHLISDMHQFSDSTTALSGPKFINKINKLLFNPFQTVGKPNHSILMLTYETKMTFTVHMIKHFFSLRKA